MENENTGTVISEQRSTEDNTTAISEGITEAIEPASEGSIKEPEEQPSVSEPCDEKAIGSESSNEVISAIKAELGDIKDRLLKDSARENLVSELRSLGELIPGADIKRLDDEAWEAIRNGGSIIYSYLMSERRAKLADEQNLRNALASTGEVFHTQSPVYTVDEIRSMDRGIVRKNLDKILRSLERGK